jgi:hypothetical protein
MASLSAAPGRLKANQVTPCFAGPQKLILWVLSSASMLLLRQYSEMKLDHLRQLPELSR